ncbi:MAG TPA: threonine synthase [Candidatus Avoscillospira stercorigallinarum]|uniref:Threonine synthase n=1 Tax=Candidatus Avoscillospira stercorigallinarum TaxID=2840708 RepID=A0A9D0Z7H5_9FIRM|nr:threonine synthase [Candidatus Avoscillospira stercorigallinarum]
MHYVSTRDQSLSYTAAQAIEQGLSRDGGLFLPETFPTLPDLETLRPMTYEQRAAAIMGLFLEGFTQEELLTFARKAYGPEKFDCPQVAPVRELHCKTHILELWHGPTCAFKDMALQMLPHLLTASMQKNGEEKTVCILVATSGDTGKAALEGFKDVNGTKIMVFYPKDGVSDIQQLQMVTQAGENVGVCAVVGNFDDAQTGVKQIFSDPAVRETLAARGYVLSSANSINWGRVLPQVVYYISAYCDLLNEGKIAMGDQINVCVPTGNFGNILACYYARKMGLPVGKLICASNANNVLTDFLKTGVYDRNRPFYNTVSPSMDILISSNLERLLFDLTGSDAEVRDYMAQLSATGRYEVSDRVKAAIGDLFVSGCCDDARTLNTIEKIFHQTGYLMDTHTAVAYTVLQDYRAATADDTVTVVASTASPFKFCDSVLEALGVADRQPGTAILDQLTQVTGKAAPAPLAALAGKAVRFTEFVEKQEMPAVVDAFLR